MPNREVTETQLMGRAFSALEGAEDPAMIAKHLRSGPSQHFLNCLATLFEDHPYHAETHRVKAELIWRGNKGKALEPINWQNEKRMLEKRGKIGAMLALGTTEYGRSVPPTKQADLAQQIAKKTGCSKATVERIYAAQAPLRKGRRKHVKRPPQKTPEN